MTNVEAQPHLEAPAADTLTADSSTGDSVPE